MIFKEKSIGLPWFSMKPQIITMYSASMTVPSGHIQLNMFLKISGGNCPVAVLLIAASASKTCQRHLETRAANVWDLVHSDQQNLAIQTGQLSRASDTTADKLTRLIIPRRFCKIDQMNYENTRQPI